MAKESPKRKPIKEEKKEEEKKVDGSERFIEAIKDHLRDYVKKDPLFLAKLKNPKKSIEDCMTYIMNQAMKNAKNGVMGYHDDDVYKLARHYYDEEDIKVGEPITNAAIAINQQVALTPEEVEDAKQKAREKVISDEMARMRKKPEKPKPHPKVTELINKDKKEEEKQDEPPTQGSLF